MMEIILPSLITAGVSLLGVVITNSTNKQKIVNDVKLENAKVVNDIKLEITAYHSSTDEKIKELTREVREHNNFAKRMPVVENDIKHIEEKITELHKND